MMKERIEAMLMETDKTQLKMSNPRYFIEGIPVPSVTQIISKCIQEDYLLGWANHLGYKRLNYSREVKKAADIGTEAHNSIEEYLREGTDNGNIGLQGFKKWWEMLNLNHKVEIIGMEESLILPYCSGTYDLLLKIDDRTFLIDLKTSNHVSYKYFLQLAAYRHMLYQIKGINIDGCIILQVDKNEPSFEEYALDFSIDEHYNFIEHCAMTFLTMAFHFYNINMAEQMYKRIF